MSGWKRATRSARSCWMWGSSQSKATPGGPRREPAAQPIRSTILKLPEEGRRHDESQGRRVQPPHITRTRGCAAVASCATDAGIPAVGTASQTQEGAKHRRKQPKAPGKPRSIDGAIRPPPVLLSTVRPRRLASPRRQTRAPPSRPVAGWRERPSGRESERRAGALGQNGESHEHWRRCGSASESPVLLRSCRASCDLRLVSQRSPGRGWNVRRRLPLTCDFYTQPSRRARLSC